MKKSLISVLTIFIIAGISSLGIADPKWISFDNSRGEFQNNDVQVLSNSWNEKAILVNVPGIVAEEVQTKGGIFTKIGFVNESYDGDFGTPQIPVIRRIIEVPFGTEINVDSSYSERKELNLNSRGYSFVLYPAQPPIPKLPGATEKAEFVFKPESYQGQLRSMPVVRVLDEGILRGHRLVKIEVRPLEYDSLKNTLTYLDRVEVKFSFPTPDIAGTKSSIEKYYSPVFEDIVKDITSGTAITDISVPERAKPGYLVICAGGLESELDSWKSWRSGEYDITVVNAGTIGTTTTSIHNYLKTAYNQSKPSYILFVGDTNTIPTFTNDGSENDIAYADLDNGGYWTTDVILGRWPARTTTQLRNIVNKTLQYGQKTFDKSFLKNTVWIASEDHASMLEATHKYCFDNYVKPADSSNNQMYKVYESQGGGTSDFASNVNAGRGIVCYSGHGYGNGSGTASVHFVKSDVYALQNTNKPMHVTVYACGTNLYGQTESFGESWLVVDKGSVTYWGTSDSSYWDEDDTLQRKTFSMLYAGNTIGKSHFTGLYAVYQNHSSTNSKYYYKIYNLMGDPALNCYLSSK